MASISKSIYNILVHSKSTLDYEAARMEHEEKNRELLRQIHTLDSAKSEQTRGYAEYIDSLHGELRQDYEMLAKEREKLNKERTTMAKECEDWMHKRS
jgi:hypothetical protein